MVDDIYDFANSLFLLWGFSFYRNIVINMNWFLYIITEDFIDDEGREIKKGQAGVGQCSMSPGIIDSYKGLMYIVPENHIREEVRKLNSQNHPSASTIRKIIEDYYNKKEVIEINKDDKNFFID